ncbi:uncharacterized protein AB675_2266 [Cyphellophora attinorum]|uniref:Uncharacterized protein n=1 Tax=Cyphellophora attinorum TaxID=1664694 RepID=A0A0N0NHZ6_9EURO|nr:uncharacterized protein AB675_2266 [Phialophora attinorum]KPI34859.1 hypothetical protein AB675_2266 [Phialophora attinorum]
MDEMMRNLLWVLQVVALYLDRSQKDLGTRQAYLQWYKTFKYQSGLVYLTRQLTTFVSAFVAREHPDLDVAQATTESVTFNFTHIHKAPSKWQGEACYRRSSNRANINFDPESRLLPVSTLNDSVFQSVWANSKSSAERMAFNSQEFTLLHELVHLCEHLARLQDGALGALLNADSYMLFAAQVAFEYAGGIYHNPSGWYNRRTVVDIISTPPSQYTTPAEWGLQPQATPRAAGSPSEVQPRPPSELQPQSLSQTAPKTLPQNQKPKLLKPKVLKPITLKAKVSKLKIDKIAIHKPEIQKPKFHRPSLGANLLNSALGCTIL